MKSEGIIKKLKSMHNPKNIEGMARFGISSENTLGVSMPVIRKMGREIGKNHELANELWASGIHEARILAGLIADPMFLTKKQMDEWAEEFDSWDVCDQVCMNLFDRTPFAYAKAKEWTGRNEEFVKRAGFALMASLAVHDKNASDDAFITLLPLIQRESRDERNFVKKAVNWALRQIGKRNLALNREAVKTAKEIAKIDSRAAQWIAQDALRELTDKKTLARTKERGAKMRVKR
ncbi:MAG: DNA alkylation repair protein [Candidatus Aenigmarchaeota archaeon]|nr:DNA alkylation repair protein [Candidatus Aenigmarchaeota archaeon]